MAEIEIDRKHYRSAYTFTNHALAIIALFKKVQNSILLNKYNKEQKYIKEFLNIINNTSIKSDSDFDEEQDNEDEDDYKENENNISERNKTKNKEYTKEIEYKERVNLNKKVLKELEKFFVFFMTLSSYQIKILNDTQPKAEIRNYLPILFQNQFKDCLSLGQNIALENLDVMNLSRYMILKDPNKLILPDNLNISPECLEKPELFGSKFIKMEDINQKEKSLQRAKRERYYEIFRKICESKNCNPKTKQLIIKAKNLVIKIIKNFDDKEIKEIIENPESLKEPIKKYMPNIEKALSRKKYSRQKSQVINHIFIDKKFSRVKTDNEYINININDKNKRKSLINKNIELFTNTESNNKNKNHSNSKRKSVDKLNLFSRNKSNKKIIKKELRKNKDSYNSTYLLSILESNNSNNSDSISD